MERMPCSPALNLRFPFRLAPITNLLQTQNALAASFLLVNRFLPAGCAAHEASAPWCVRARALRCVSPAPPRFLRVSRYGLNGGGPKVPYVKSVGFPHKWKAKMFHVKDFRLPFVFRSKDYPSTPRRPPKARGLFGKRAGCGDRQPARASTRVVAAEGAKEICRFRTQEWRRAV